MTQKELNKEHLKKLLSLKPEVTLLGPDWDPQTNLFPKEKNILYDLVLNCSFEKIGSSQIETSP